MDGSKGKEVISPVCRVVFIILSGRSRFLVGRRGGGKVEGVLVCVCVGIGLTFWWGGGGGVYVLFMW